MFACVQKGEFLEEENNTAEEGLEAKIRADARMSGRVVVALLRSAWHRRGGQFGGLRNIEVNFPALRRSTVNPDGPKGVASTLGFRQIRSLARNRCLRQNNLAGHDCAWHQRLDIAVDKHELRGPLRPSQSGVTRLVARPDHIQVKQRS